jgi:hypothetical protein
MNDGVVGDTRVTWAGVALWDPPVTTRSKLAAADGPNETLRPSRGAPVMIVISQALTSITNAVLGVEMARTVQPRDLGVLGLLMSIYVVAVAASRASCSELCLQVPTIGDEPKARKVVVAFGLLAGIAVLIVGLLVPSELRVGVIALALGLPCLLLQDFERYVSFRNRPAVAALGDATWLAVLLIGIGVIEVTGIAAPSLTIVLWVISGAAGLAVMRQSTGGITRADFASGWWQAHPNRGRAYLVETGITTVSQGLMIPIVALRYGLIAAGEVRAYLTFLGPTIFGVQAAGLISARRIGGLSRRGDYLRDGWAVGSSIAGGCCALAAAAVARFVGIGTGTSVLGPSWAAVSSTWLLTLAAGVVAPLLVAPLIVTRLVLPRSTSAVRGIAGVGGLVFAVAAPIGRGLATFAAATLVTQSIIGAYVLVSMRKVSEVDALDRQSLTIREDVHAGAPHAGSTPGVWAKRW